MRVRLVHTTRLSYSADVVERVMDVRLGPLNDDDQRCDGFSLITNPAASIRGYVDGFGNRGYLVTVARPHRAIELVARSEVTTLLDDPTRTGSRRPAPLGPAEMMDGLTHSKLAPVSDAIVGLAEPLRPSTPSDGFAAVTALSSLVRDTLDYRPNVTSVTTTSIDALALGAGVCQDFTHLLIAMCRAIGIPARYVSGYTIAGAAETRGSPEQSHAWAEAWTPTHGWRGFDPTNGVVVGPNHVKAAIGRDYADVPPTRGTWRGSADERLAVRVESARIE